MRRAGRMTAECLDMLTDYVKPGVTTEFLDKLAFDFIRDHGAYPACLHYRGYTKSICTSINHVVCHGIPNDKPLRDGDIMNIDVTLILDGWHGDSSRMYYVGEVPRRAQRLCEITYECLMRGIAAVKPGATTNDIGAAIQSYAEAERCSVVRDFCGHGLGQRLPRFADDPPLRGAGLQRGAEARHALHHRAHDQSRPPAGEGALRRLDRRDPRPLPLGPVRAHGRRDGDRRRGLHLLAEGPGQAALRGSLTLACGIASSLQRNNDAPRSARSVCYGMTGRRRA